MEGQSTIKYIVLTISTSVVAGLMVLWLGDCFHMGTSGNTGSQVEKPVITEPHKEPEFRSKDEPKVEQPEDVVKTDTAQKLVVTPQKAEPEVPKQQQPFDFSFIPETDNRYKFSENKFAFYPLPFVPGLSRPEGQGSIALFTSLRIKESLKLVLLDSKSSEAYFTSSKLLKSDINLYNKKDGVSIIPNLNAGEYSMQVSDYESGKSLKTIKVPIRGNEYTAIDLGKYLSE